MAIDLRFVAGSGCCALWSADAAAVDDSFGDIGHRVDCDQSFE